MYIYVYVYIYIYSYILRLYIALPKDIDIIFLIFGRKSTFLWKASSCFFFLIN